MKCVRWGLLASGAIARAFAAGVKNTSRGRVDAVASRSIDKAQAFAGEFGIGRAYGSYEDLLADPDIDAVYISTPHPMHAHWAIRAARAGKHILCEKPIAINHADTMTMIEAARANDVFLMEAFMYRCHPQTAKIAELIREGVIGQVRVIHAQFSFSCGYNLQSRLLNNGLGGGGVLDVGCYPVSMARLVAGAALGRDYADPVQVAGAGHVGPESHVDEWAVGILKFEGDIVAQVSSGVQLSQENALTIYGSSGRISVPNPWVASRQGPAQGMIVVERYGDRSREEIAVPTDKSSYTHEAEVVAGSVERRQAAAPAMSWGDSLGNIATLDRWREALGVVYQAEEASAYAVPLGGVPLSPSRVAAMPYGRIEGLDKDVSRLAMGVDNQRTIAHTTAMFDDYIRRGGNSFDTSWVYGGGTMERLLGQWVKSRSIRDDVVILCKGAHTPWCTPEYLRDQFHESLDRLQTDYADIYLMHRDNPDVPAGEFVDVMDELRGEGLMRAFGGSNWSPARVDEANAWARTHKKHGFSAVSNNFSLARMVDPVWAGCIASSEPSIREWHERTQMPLFAWSSQARGFFVPERSSLEKKSDPQLVRCWYSDDNFARQARCFELARKLDVHPIRVALAYVLHQSFPVFALIGPRTIGETVDSFAGLAITLNPEQVRWLDSGD